MRAGDRKPLYRHLEVALLRAAAAPLTETVEWWLDPADTEACRRWLEEMWSRPDLADAVRLASPSLGEGVDAIRAGRRAVGGKQIRGAALSTARYLLRSIGRPTPFGLFAGVAPVSLGGAAQTDWAMAVDHGWQARAEALAAYRKHLPPEADLNRVVESLLHMHHNRALGIDPDGERACRRLARQAALAWRARHQGGDGR